MMRNDALHSFAKQIALRVRPLGPLGVGRRATCGRDDQHGEGGQRPSFHAVL